jgi:hypothetical protein
VLELARASRADLINRMASANPLIKLDNLINDVSCAANSADSSAGAEFTADSIAVK